MPVEPAPLDSLTPREAEVLLLVAEGYTDAGLAQVLGMSAATARTHVQTIRRKLGAASRAEAVARAMAAGLLRR